MWWKLTLTTSFARSLMKINLYKVYSYNNITYTSYRAFKTEDFHAYNLYLQKTYYKG